MGGQTNALVLRSARIGLIFPGSWESSLHSQDSQREQAGGYLTPSWPPAQYRRGELAGRRDAQPGAGFQLVNSCVGHHLLHVLFHLNYCCYCCFLSLCAVSLNPPYLRSQGFSQFSPSHRGQGGVSEWPCGALLPADIQWWHPAQTNPALTRCRPFSVHKRNAKRGSTPVRGAERFSCLQMPLALMAGSCRALPLKICVISRTDHLRLTSHTMLLHSEGKRRAWRRGGVCPGHAASQADLATAGRRESSSLTCRVPIYPRWTEKTHPRAGETNRSEGMGTAGQGKERLVACGEMMRFASRGSESKLESAMDRKLSEVCFNNCAHVLTRFLIK